MALALLERSIDGDLRLGRVAVESDEDFVMTVLNTRVARKTERYPNRSGFELNLVLTRNSVK